MAAEEDARQRANDERAQQYPIDPSQKPVADTRDQGQRHGMGDVGADEAGDRGARVEQNESRHPDGAGTDRGERHEYPEQEPGEGRQCRGPPRIRLRMPRRGQQTEPPMREDADRGHDKGDAQSGGDQRRRGVALDAQDMEREEREDCSRDAAGSEPAGDAPVHRSFESMRQRAAGLGYRRVEGSVSTAVVACTPNSRTRIGVISEPPPIPLSPTSMPTTKPDTTKSGLIAANRSMSSYARSLTALLKS